MVNKIPSWLKDALDETGADFIEAAVKEGEKRTAGEIVPVIVQGSTINVSAPLLAVFIAGFVVLALKHGFWLYEIAEPTSIWFWSALFLAAICGGFVFGNHPKGQMLLTPRWEKRRQVQQRALLAFYQADLTQTEGRTGILLFVSWRERQAVVLADEGIAQHCDKSAFEGVVAELIRGAKDGQLAKGYAKAIDMSANILAKHIPIQRDDVNELKDSLRIID
ncbi:MAG: hypothetical protein H7249_19895 [Chitinophagaceae bacterium]|nr:hypothetical protein [Oligoflexus sp.]